MIIIETRGIRVVNTDPQKRCYNGCNYSESHVWSEWSDLEFVTTQNSQERIKFWTELNDYAVSQRGNSAKREYRKKHDI